MGQERNVEGKKRKLGRPSSPPSSLSIGGGGKRRGKKEERGKKNPLPCAAIRERGKNGGSGEKKEKEKKGGRSRSYLSIFSTARG